MQIDDLHREDDLPLACRDRCGDLRDVELNVTGAGAWRRELPVRRTLLTWVRKALARPAASLSFVFLDKEEARGYNRDYRKRDYATNVLTFDYDHGPFVSADIVVCVPVVAEEALSQGKTFREHLAHMIVHSVLHAQGWDHETADEAEAMEAEETRILAALGFPDPYADDARPEEPLQIES